MNTNPDRRCKEWRTDDCPPPSHRHARTLMLREGEWYCPVHLKGRGFQTNCTHSLGFNLGTCPFCGAPRPKEEPHGS